MKRKAAALLLVAGAVLLVDLAAAAAEKQTLHMAYWAGPSHHMVKTLEAWIKTIEAASGGNLTVEVDKAPLAKPDGQYDVVKDGIRDMAWVVPGYTPGRFELFRVAELPFICPNATICAPALWQWYAKHQLADREFTDSRIVTAFMTGPFSVHTTKPVKTLEEIKGLKIRTAGAGVPIAKALGMTVVALTATDTNQALQRGTVDGTLFPWEAMDSFRLTELVKAHLEIPGGFYAADFFININPKSLERLTPANQKALLQAGGEAGSALFGKAWDAADTAGRISAKERGNLIQTIAAAELDRWRPMLQFVRDEWLKSAKERGVDGPALLADFEATVKATAAR